MTSLSLLALSSSSTDSSTVDFEESLSLMPSDKLHSPSGVTKQLPDSTTQSWIPYYLYSTAYGERYRYSNSNEGSKAFGSQNGLNSDKLSSKELSIAPHKSRSAMDAEDSRSSAVSASQFNLPQIFPSRSAAQLDALGLWHQMSSPVYLSSATTNYNNDSTESGGGPSNSSLRRLDSFTPSNGSAHPSETANSNGVEESKHGLPPVPTAWIKRDTEQPITISSDGTGLSFVSETNPTARETATVRTAVPVPVSCSVYYFEVEVLSYGKEGLISIGICGEGVPLNKVPGLELNSWGYHSDDGRTIACQGTAKPYGSKYGAGDVIGCGINFRKQSVFYTKNGLPLGVAFRDVRTSKDSSGSDMGPIFPCIGIKAGESVHTNFGQSEFRFDIKQYIRDEKSKVMSQINNSGTQYLSEDLADPDARGLITSLISSYFTHVGYVETAQAFNSECQEFDPDANDATDKMDVDQEPDSVDSEKRQTKQEIDIYNRQRIRGLIMDGDIDAALKLVRLFYPQVLEANDLIHFKLRCRKLIEMIRYMTEKSNDSESFDNLLASAMQYGQQLRSDYKDDTRVYVHTMLTEAFSLFAYEDPSKAPDVAHLLERSELVPLAEELNSEILVSLGKPSVPSLKRLAQHATQLVWELNDRNQPNVSILNIHDDYLGSN